MKRFPPLPSPWVLPLVAVLLFGITVASRIPFVSRMLYAWDSGNFALALEYYNVTFHQPQPPGYPLYVGLAKLVELWVGDANASYVHLSVFASAAAVALLFLLASRMYDPWTGAIAAILLGTSVGFWGYSEVAYPYIWLPFLGTLVAWPCYLIWRGHRWPAVLLGLALGLAGGLRQDILLFLGPLWLASLWRVGIRRLLLSTLVLGLTIASWLVSAAQLSGGWAAFQEAGAIQSDYVLGTYSILGQGLDGVRRNTETLMLFLKQVAGLGLAVAVYFAGRFLTFKALVADHRLPFLLLWLLPPTLVYTLVHIGDPGYALSLLPPLCIATAVGIRDIVHDLRSALLLLSARYQRIAGLAGLAGPGGTGVAVLMVVGLVAWNANAFLTSPGPARLPEIRAIDAILTAQTEYARRFEAGSAVILAKARFRQMQYYLPEYEVRLLYDEYHGDYRAARTSHQIPQNATTVLVMDFGKRPERFSGTAGRQIALSDSPEITLWQFDVTPGDTIEYGYDYFGVR